MFYSDTTLQGPSRWDGGFSTRLTGGPEWQRKARLEKGALGRRTPRGSRGRRGHQARQASGEAPGRLREVQEGLQARRSETPLWEDVGSWLQAEGRDHGSGSRQEAANLFQIVAGVIFVVGDS